MTKREELEALKSGEGCLARSQEDEPVFILVARDRGAATVVRIWAMVAELLDAPFVKVQEARELALRMDDWRLKHGGGKVPD